MHNPDSFIEEVTEEVRRDRLFAAFRKYGWIGAVVVVAIVGGTAWREWTAAQAVARAEAFGDSLLEALDVGGSAERREALAAVQATGGQKAIVDLLLASDPVEDRAATLEALDRLMADQSQPQSLRDLATLRRVVVVSTDMPLADRQAALDGIAQPGKPFRTLAQEQLAYLQIEAGDTAGAIALLQALTVDQEASGPLRSRAAQVITALGGAPATDAG
ncbi:MAG: hypothetical protein HZT43_11215 [Exiguobacterium profundum]|nr:MAG: hypothetical protein HZT43_11215 [Exiguobacterium profundum]